MKKSALDQHIAALADVVPKDFVRERNALAGKLKGRDASLARAVRDLPRPSPTAWALNQLARHHEGNLQAYLDAADELQSVQMGRTKTGSLADAIRLERASRQMLVKQVSGVLSAAKINVTPELRRRIADTLLAAATGPSRKDLERGLLRSDLEVTGLPDVGITTPAAGRAAEAARGHTGKAPVAADRTASPREATRCEEGTRSARTA